MRVLMASWDLAGLSPLCDFNNQVRRVYIGKAALPCRDTACTSELPAAELQIGYPWAIIRSGFVEEAHYDRIGHGLYFSPLRLADRN